MVMSVKSCFAALNPSVSDHEVRPTNKREPSKLKQNSCFAKDYPALLVSLASMIRSGNDPISALGECRDLFKQHSEMYRQLDAFRDNLAVGMTEGEAINAFGCDLQFREAQLFRSVLRLSRNEGASLGQSLMRLAKVTRQRQSFERKVRAAIAMQRLSTLGLVLCALLTLGFQALTNLKAIEAAFRHDWGALFMLLGVVLLASGSVWMLLLSRRQVGVGR